MDMPNITPEIDAIVRDFAARVEAIARIQTGERILSIVAAAMMSQETPAAAPSKVAKSHQGAATQKRSKIKLSAKGLAVRRLQGQYMGALRSLRPGAKARVKKLARAQGVAAAVMLALSLK